MKDKVYNRLTLSLFFNHFLIRIICNYLIHRDFLNGNVAISSVIGNDYNNVHTYEVKDHLKRLIYKEEANLMYKYSPSLNEKKGCICTLICLLLKFLSKNFAAKCNKFILINHTNE